eukprot:5956660-Amphidinium_carterae.1
MDITVLSCTSSASSSVISSAGQLFMKGCSTQPDKLVNVGIVRVFFRRKHCKQIKQRNAGNNAARCPPFGWARRHSSLCVSIADMVGDDQIWCCPSLDSNHRKASQHNDECAVMGSKIGLHCSVLKMTVSEQSSPCWLKLGRAAACVMRRGGCY